MGAVPLPALGQTQPSSPPPSTPDQSEPENKTPTGRDVLLMFADGKRVEGVLIDRTPDRVVIRLAGIEMVYPMHQIDSIRYLPPIQERYRQLREIIPDNDTHGIIRLSQWLMEHALLNEALLEINNALKNDPDHPQAKKQKLLIEQQILLQQRAALPPKEKTQPEQTARSRQGQPAVLNDEQINLMRVYEVDLNNPPRLLIKRSVIDELIQRYASSDLIPDTPESQKALYHASPTQILDLMFQLRARDFYSKVKVLDHPTAIKLFRDDVQSTWLINACATNRCHGGTDAGNLQLVNRKRNSNAATYTNLLILEKTITKDGKPLVNYDKPANSPLLQAAVVEARSSRPHPPVKGYRPIFRSQDDIRFRKAVRWISSMYQPRPEYPIKYQLPKKQVVQESQQSPGPR